MDPPLATLRFQFSSDDEVTFGEPWERHVERWTVTVTDVGGDPVGYAHVLILSLGQFEVADLVDAVTGAWREPSGPVGSGATAGKDGAGEDGAGGDGAGEDGAGEGGAGEGGAGTAAILGAHVLVLDRVFIEPRMRGGRLGPAVAAIAIARLSRGCNIAVCFPAPLDSRQDDDDRQRSVEALGRIWSTVGFRGRPDGVWVLDLDDDTLPVAIGQLMTGDAVTTAMPLTPGARRGIP